MSVPGGTRKGAVPRTFLLVDADPSLRTTAKLHLASAGLEVREVADQEGALQAVRTQPVELVIGPAHGPHFEGAQFIATVRADPDPRVRGTPVLLVAEGSLDEVSRLCKKHWPACGVVAPVTGPRLVEAVARLLSRG